MKNSIYKTVSTQYFKTHFASLIREVQTGEVCEGIKVKSHNRVLGIFIPVKQRKNTDLNDLI